MANSLGDKWMQIDYSMYLAMSLLKQAGTEDKKSATNLSTVKLKTVSQMPVLKPINWLISEEIMDSAS